mgnify:CR=1 FL=1
MRLQTTDLYLKIDEEIKSGQRYVFLRGSSRSGKSVTAIQYMIVECLTNPNTTVTVARETAVSIRNTILLDFKTQMEKIGQWVDGKFNKVEMLYRFDNGSTMRFIGLDDTTGKLRGLSSSIVFIDEVNTVDVASFMQLDIRCEKYIISAYNPEITEDSWILDYEKKENATLIISTWRDNPFLPQKIIDSINSLKELDYEKWLIYSESKIVPPREKIFPQPKTVETLPQTKEIYYGIDFGYATDPCAVLEMRVRGNEIYVEELLYENGLTNEDLLYRLKEIGLTRDNDIVADSSEPKSIAELKRGGLNVVGIKKGQGSVLYGIQKMRQYKIFVTERSTNLLNEFSNYKFKKDRSGRVTNTPIGDDHLLDALRYCVMNYLDKPKTTYSFI